MGKSGKKKRRAAAKRRELDRIRGVSLMDSKSPQPGFDASPNPLNAEHLRNYGKPESASKENEHKEKHERDTKGSIGSEALARKRIDFVLPRAKGKAETYIFDKQARALINENLPPIPEETTAEKMRELDSAESRRNETVDDIFMAKKAKRKKLADTFEAIHQDEVAQQQKAEDSIRAPKKKKKRSSSVGSRDSESTSEPSESTKQKKRAYYIESPDAVSEPGNDAKSKRRSSSVESRDSTSNRDTKQKEMATKTAKPQHQVDQSVKTQMAPVHRQLSGRSVEEAVQDKPGLRPRANSTDGELNLPQRGLCDEQMVLRAHRWEDERSYVHQVVPRGLVNVGNTCFLNSILQCLAYLPPFCQSLIHISESKVNQRKGFQKLSKGQKITTSLCNLFQRVHGFSPDALGETSIAPTAVVKALPSLGSVGSRDGYKFRPGRQEDAHEFLVHLLDAMHDGELRSAGINQHVSGWRDRLPVSRLDETTFIHRIFGGYFRSQVRCKCGYRSNTYDPFLDLSLEVSKKSSNSVLFALSEFTRKERLDSDNQWKCSGCKKYVCPTKQLTVFRPPLSLCIQLKRFSFDGGFGGRAFSSFGAGGSWKYGKSHNNFRGGCKITKPIQFPADLDLPLSDGRSCAYSLTGVVIHVGGSASSGHYTAYVKKPSRKGKFQWYHADDSFVEPVSEKTVLRQKDAYILFYCRKEVKLEFPDPPPRDMSTEEARKLGRARARVRADSSSTLEPLERQTKRPVESMPQSAAAVGAQSFKVGTATTGIHPLAQMLNSTMSEHFKTTLAPIAKEKEGKPTSDESSSDDSSDSSDDDQSADSSDENSSETSSRLPVLGIQRLEPALEKQFLGSNGGIDISSSESETSSVESSERLVKVTAKKGASVPLGTGKKLEAIPEEVSVRMPEKNHTKTRVVVGNSDSRGKVSVMMGPRKRKAWVSKHAATAKKESGFQLLGNIGVSRWDDEETNDDSLGPQTGLKPALEARGQIVAKIEKQEKTRKRKMHLDRWDSVLDQGKCKKTKKSAGNGDAENFQNPKKNMFQRIQSGIQRMNKGKPKGLFRRRMNGDKKKRRGKF